MGHWKEDYRFGSIVVWPPDEVRRQINPLRERYDPRSHSICEAHVTVTQPFLVSPREKELDKLISIVSSFEAFEITYGPLNHFLPYPCIYYAIHPVAYFLEIRVSLHRSGLFNLSLPYTDGFIPHMSITDGMPDAEMTKEIFQESQTELTGGSFQCDSLALIEPDEQFVFHVSQLLYLH